MCAGDKWGWEGLGSFVERPGSKAGGLIGVPGAFLAYFTYCSAFGSFALVLTLHAVMKWIIA